MAVASCKEIKDGRHACKFAPLLLRGSRRLYYTDENIDYFNKHTVLYHDDLFLAPFKRTKKAANTAYIKHQRRVSLTTHYKKLSNTATLRS